MDTFDARAHKALKHYVYALFASADAQFPFYVGKGQGNRVFAHALDKRVDRSKTDELPLKLETIRALPEGQLVHRFIRTGLKDEKAAHAIESVVIDTLEQVNPGGLTNQAAGHGGKWGMEECSASLARLNAKPLRSDRRLLILQVSQTLGQLNRSGAREFEFTPNEVFEAARGEWRINEERLREIECCVAVYRGFVVGVFVPRSWRQLDNGKRQMVGRRDASAFQDLMWARVGSDILPARTQMVYYPRA